jgi:hypothetical protein
MNEKINKDTDKNLEKVMFEISNTFNKFANFQSKSN